MRTDSTVDLGLTAIEFSHFLRPASFPAEKDYGAKLTQTKKERKKTIQEVYASILFPYLHTVSVLRGQSKNDYRDLREACTHRVHFHSSDGVIGNQGTEQS